MATRDYKYFQKQLKIGQLYEKMAQQQLMKYYDNKYVVISTCDNNKYDFMMTNNMKYEVKADVLSSKTGYIFIENIQYDKASGIDVTEADYYIIIVVTSNMFKSFEQYLMIDVSVLKQLITDKLYTKIYSDKFKSGYLFNLEYFETQCTTI